MSFIDFKSKAALKQHLLPDPFIVHPNDLDPAKVDISDIHRAEMKKKLYSIKRNQFKPKLDSPNEALSSLRNYADEQTPAWQSTMKESFIAKKSDNSLIAKQSARLANATNFKLEFHDAPNNSTSVTKQDFIKHQIYENPLKNIQKPVSKYSFIECEEMGEPLPRKVLIPKSKPVSRLKQISFEIDQNELPKRISHISFGNEVTDWTTVSHQPVPNVKRTERVPTEYERLEKQKSSVLDNPDLVLDSKMQTVSQASYQISDSIDRKDLIHDTSNSRHALCGTHFTLGNEEATIYKSEYDSTFLCRPNQLTKPVKAENSNHLAIIAEDYVDRKIGNDTTSKADFRKINLPERTLASDIKNENSKTSIVLGNESEGFKNAISSSKHDFRLPMAVGPLLAKENYLKGGKIEAQSRCIPFQDLVGNLDGGDVAKVSTNKSDYGVIKNQAELYKESKSKGELLKGDGSKPHFSLKNDPEGIISQSISKTSFVDPKSIAATLKEAKTAGKAHALSSTIPSFATTFQNTISADPESGAGHYSTTFGSTFTSPRGIIKTTAVLPPRGSIEMHMHPQQIAVETKNGIEFKCVRDISSVSRRSFVPPEVMK